MITKPKLFTHHNTSTCIGTGLQALDIIINGDGEIPPRYSAGGSCGNVLTILSYLGWRSFPIARLGSDSAAKGIQDDMSYFDVQLDFIEQDEKVRSPIVIERIQNRAKGTPTHNFLFVCPHCGSWLPRYRPILLRKAKSLTKKLPEMDIFYYDRATAGTVELARAARERGALVVFEPPNINNTSKFLQAVELSHIIKYSGRHTESIHSHIDKTDFFLLIETLGPKGLRFQLANNNKSRDGWRHLKGFKVSDLVDSAGSGDWCTAGIIHLLGRNGYSGIKDISERHIIESLKFGQALAALNCRFEGARGMMYALTKDELEEEFFNILSHRLVVKPLPLNVPEGQSSLMQCICITDDRVSPVLR